LKLNNLEVFRDIITMSHLVRAVDGSLPVSHGKSLPLASFPEFPNNKITNVKRE
jgi:hypothetical protein